MLMPKHRIVILPRVNMVMFVRKRPNGGVRVYYYHPTSDSLKRLNRTLNGLINEPGKLRVELGDGAFTVRWPREDVKGFEQV